ncbi:MAG: DUF4115 domain-containing protein [Neisseriaceae bacterium]|nr:DUF4115 domain-containing protein [Neisseriaceae bacterium]
MNKEVKHDPQEWRVQIGDSLNKARVFKNISLAEVSDYLKLRVNQIKDIEEGRWDSLPDAVFARGFIRNYAQMLEIEEDIQPLLDNALPNSNHLIKRNINVSHRIISNKKLPVWINILILLIIFMVVIFIWQKYSSNRTLKLDEAQLEQEITAPALQVGDINTKVIPLIENTASEVYDESSEISDNILYINAKYRTYLHVTDSSNKVLINQIVPGGSRHQFNGLPPYRIKIGYAIGSTVELNGKAYDVKANTNSKVANLTVP